VPNNLPATVADDVPATDELDTVAEDVPATEELATVAEDVPATDKLATVAKDVPAIIELGLGSVVHDADTPTLTGKLVFFLPVKLFFGAILNSKIKENILFEKQIISLFTFIRSKNKYNKTIYILETWVKN